MPCNFNQRRLAEHVKEGIRAAGGTPMEFNTVGVSDGVTMGTEGMKASLVSREVVADSIELVVRGHLFDGVVCLVGCDKTGPARRWPSAASTSPAWSSTTGRSTRACYKGKRNATVVIVFEAIGAYRAGKITPRGAVRGRERACPGAGACGGQFTANTMRMVLEFMGLSPAGLNGIPAEDPAKDDAARRTGELVMDLVRADRAAVALRHPRVARERDRLGRGDRRLARTACSTCWRSPTSSASRSTSTSSAPSPTGRRSIADMQPGGRYTASDMYDAGGVGARHARAAQAAGPAPRRRADGRRPDDRPDRGATRSETPGQEVVVPIDDAAQADRRPGDPARLARARWLRRQAGRPRAPPAPRPGPRLRLGDGLLRRRRATARSCPATSSSSATRARSAGRGCRRCCSVTGGARRRGARRLGRAADRRPLLRRDARPDDRPRRARGGARRPDRDRRRGRHDRHRRRSTAARPRRPGRRGRPPRFERWTPPAHR